jgi:hypothetical protein
VDLTGTGTGTGAGEISVRSVLFGTASFVGLCILPVLVKWMLVGRWKVEEIRVWGLPALSLLSGWPGLVRGSPMALSAGSPLP